MTNILLIAIAYIIGMIPNAMLFGLMFNRASFEAIRSDAMGPEDIIRQFLKLPVFLTIMTDFLKGMLVVFLGMQFAQAAPMPMIMLFAALLARNYNVLIGLRGGKGVAMMLGGMVLIGPWSIPVYLVIVLIIFGVMRDLDYALGIGSVGLPAALVIGTGEIHYIFTGILIAMSIIAKHIDYTNTKANRYYAEKHERGNPFHPKNRR